MRLAYVVLAGCGRLGVEPVDDAVVVDVSVDVPADVAITVTEALIDCATGPKTLAQICIDAGFSAATTARGYHWFQCAGPDACPVGWSSDGVSCANWCAGGDCVGWDYCGANPVSQVLTERVFAAGDTVNPSAHGYAPCGGYNPGWLIRAYCVN